MELYKTYRPTLLERVRGQDPAIKMISAWVRDNEIPHAIVITGPSGTGKTTLARILKRELECSDMDYQEVNGADDTGVDMVRGIRDKMRAAPFGGKCRIYVIDECHMLSKNAQNCILKALEDTPPHVYFILATTDPGKLLKTIQTRCTEVVLKSINPKNLGEILDYVLRKEKMEITPEVREKILTLSDGSARQALVFLDQIKGLTDPEEQLDTITPSAVAAVAFNIYREISNYKPNWANVAKILRELEDDPEGVRRLILACARGSLLKEGGKYAPRAYQIIQVFRDNYFNSGTAGLAADCYELCSSAGK